MNETTTGRSLSIGAWVMLGAAIVGVPFAAVAIAITVVYGIAVNPVIPNMQARHPLLTIVWLIAVLFALLAAIVFVFGVALYVIVPALSSKETARRGYASWGTVLASLLLAVVISTVIQGIFAVGQVMSSGSYERALSLQLTPVALIVDILSLELALLFVLWLRVIRPGIITWQDMGLSAAYLGRKILIGIGTGFTVIVVAGLIEYALRNFFGVEQTQPQEFQAVTSATPPQFALVLFAGAMVAPLAEEAFFRGYVVTGFTRRGAIISAFVFSALLFATAHFNWQAFIPIFVIGLMLAYVFWRTQSIVPTMIAHAMNNAIAFIDLRYGDAIQQWLQQLQR